MAISVGGEEKVERRAGSDQEGQASSDDGLVIGFLSLYGICLH